ncbi:MAG: 50S ribosomal protein L11 methyltransferase [Pseudomonadota bacterium]
MINAVAMGKTITDSAPPSHKQPAWQQLCVTVHQAHAEAISDFLSEAGALAVSLVDAENQALFEPNIGETPLWSSVKIKGLFPRQYDIPALEKQLVRVFGADKIMYSTCSDLADQNWLEVCKNDFHPLRFGERLWIYPSWEPPEHINHSDVAVLLDPGLAFGTGSHPTTALCLQWLARSLRGDEIVIDYGCGSGILAIAAAKLGCHQVIAIDNDPQALEAAAENCTRNQVKLTIASPEKLPDISADVMIANILAQPLIELKPKFIHLLKQHGKLILSGILNEQMDSVVNAYQPEFNIDTVCSQEAWALIVAEKL